MQKWHKKLEKSRLFFIFWPNSTIIELYSFLIELKVVRNVILMSFSKEKKLEWRGSERKPPSDLLGDGLCPRKNSFTCDHNFSTLRIRDCIYFSKVSLKVTRIYAGCSETLAYKKKVIDFLHFLGHLFFSNFMELYIFSLFSET